MATLGSYWTKYSIELVFWVTGLELVGPRLTLRWGPDARGVGALSFGCSSVCATADLNPRAALGDKGYDFKSNRDAARQRGICPAIPYRSNTKDMPTFFPRTLYKARARIEQAVSKLKRFKRIALRCEKTAQNYGSFVA